MQDCNRLKFGSPADTVSLDRGKTAVAVAAVAVTDDDMADIRHCTPICIQLNQNRFRFSAE
jgi:hypothetical protein